VGADVAAGEQKCPERTRAVLARWCRLGVWLRRAAVARDSVAGELGAIEQGVSQRGDGRKVSRAREGCCGEVVSSVCSVKPIFGARKGCCGGVVGAACGCGCARTTAVR